MIEKAMMRDYTMYADDAQFVRQRSRCGW
jgi:hypothetical protein